ncbi:MAG: hypothetical protein L3J67_06910 [Hyphomicrobiaceae bacterium]|nr:hypothetical protein [Hyphomicrobiaceae bacterium]
MKQILLHVLLLLSTAMGAMPASACALGFSFNFEPLPEQYGRQALSQKTFLDKLYGKRGWVWAQHPLRIKVPKRAENSNVIPVSVGAVAPDLPGVYQELTLFRINLVTVIEFAGEKEVAKRLPSQVDILKMQNFDPYTGRTSQLEGGIEKIVAFKLSPLALPFAKTRIRANGASAIHLFASFVPKDKQAPVQIVKAPHKTEARHPCHHQLYVYGKWPKNLRKSYRYE